MANQNASLSAALAATPQTLTKGNQQGGELRVFHSTYTNPSSGGVVIGQRVSWGWLPRGARIVGGILSCSAGTASSTLNLGDAATPARYLAATSVASATTITVVPLPNAVGGAGFEIDVVAPGAATDQSEIRSVCAGANLAANQTFNLTLYYVTND